MMEDQLKSVEEKLSYIVFDPTIVKVKGKWYHTKARGLNNLDFDIYFFTDSRDNLIEYIASCCPEIGKSYTTIIGENRHRLGIINGKDLEELWDNVSKYAEHIEINKISYKIRDILNI